MSRPILMQPEDPTGETEDLGTMTFRQACEAFLESREPFLNARTMRDYHYCKKWLVQGFGTKRLNDITAHDIRKYQQERMQRCGTAMINHETSILQQMLKRIGRWPQVGLGFQPLALPRESPGRAISDDEEQRLLRAGASNPRWEAAYFFTLISLHTTMGPGEVQTLRRKDVDVEKRTVTVNAEGAKNANRIRLIPLNDIALRVFQEVLVVAEKKGSVLPEHYVFPFRVTRGHYDPTRRCTTFKTAWEQMLCTAGIEKLRMYDLRHTAITRLCEDPNNSEETVEVIAGHITHAMKKRYSHVRIEARRAALAGLVPERLDRNYAAMLAKEHANGNGKGPVRTGKPLNNEQVLDMVQSGIPAKAIVAKIERWASLTLRPRA